LDHRATPTFARQPEVERSPVELNRSVGVPGRVERASPFERYNSAVCR
jgi:hypothetical protein